MKTIVFLFFGLICLNADIIMSVKSIKPNGGAIQYSPFVFQKQIGREMYVYMLGEGSGEMLKYDNKTGKISSFGGILNSSQGMAPKQMYIFTNKELILKNSNVHILANNDQKYALSKSDKNNCFIADEVGGRKDHLLLCLYSLPLKRD